jgi:hypothetical protein
MRRLIWLLGLTAACGGGGGGATLIDATPTPVTWDYGPGAAIVSAADFSLVTSVGIVLHGTGAPTITGSGFTTGTNEGTLEVEWTENANTMRLYFYFARSGGRWNVSQVQHWDGSESRNWVYYQGPLFDTPDGATFMGDVNLEHESGDNSVHFRGLTLTAFGRELPPP